FDQGPPDVVPVVGSIHEDRGISITILPEVHRCFPIAREEGPAFRKGRAIKLIQKLCCGRPVYQHAEEKYRAPLAHPYTMRPMRIGKKTKQKHRREVYNYS